MYESTSLRESRRFSRFRQGEKRRMGVVISQEKTLTVDQLLLIGEIAEKDRINLDYEEENK